ncbi:T9SS type A sorting domain-containing protein [Neotamlana laminarinivorans]|uniref:T9SS type A sorting domain-containing protein n=1 Tax=Neotamlana laminarinivorans TaxID=2883124 RepID=A0A9X1L530_9FLAO|nr:T9SS type A sorting domain-containing protein [Tamlana laminarinivorans]MCB4799977.1 T9SS type A sorting domain-containing protein [Tamlana laminarinivorans]
MKKHLLILITTFSINVFAQELSFTEERNINFNKDYDSYISEHIRSGFTIDNEDNKIIVGQFDGVDVDFGGPNLIDSEEDFNIFIAKYNKNNDLLWFKNLGSTYFQLPHYSGKYYTNDFASDVKVDSENNIYVLATLDVGTPETVDLDAEHPTTNSIITTSNSPALGSNNNLNLFLIKYSSNGMLLWYKEIQDDFSEISLKLHVDANDNVLFTGYNLGYTSHIIDFDPYNTYPDDIDLIPGEFFMLGFIVKYDSEGNFINVYGTGNGRISDLHARGLPSGNIYASGSFSASISSDTSNPFGLGLSLFKNKENPTYIESLGYFEFAPQNEDIFITKYDNTGQVLWVNTISSTLENRISEMVFDENENIYVSGRINGASVDFDTNNSSSTDMLSAVSGGSAFIAKYSGVDGSLIWAKTILGGNFSIVRGLAIKNNKLVLAGEFNGAITIGTSSLNTSITNPFMAIMDTDGNWEKAGKIEKLTFASISDIRIDNDGAIHYFGFDAVSVSNNIHNVKNMFLGKVNDVTLSIDNPNLGIFTIFPNPTNGKIYIKNNSNIKIKEINIYDMLGKLVLTEKNLINSFIDISLLPLGAYICNIKTAENSFYNSKIIKK